MQGVAKKRKVTPFAERLRALRNAAGFTQQAVADELDIGIQTYMRWERGETEPSFSELCAIAAMFGKTPNDFLPDDLDDPDPPKPKRKGKK
ncbi:MAG TPA: helix-turn-helix transcriptional regulator [Gemmataceae bacterium]|nr:helix-turn-helix transcriptional regulator [Gemmataceae bacterium]